jgi:hypothetical protein
MSEPLSAALARIRRRGGHDRPALKPRVNDLVACELPGPTDIRHIGSRPVIERQFDSPKPEPISSTTCLRREANLLQTGRFPRNPPIWRVSAAEWAFDIPFPRRRVQPTA